MSHKRHLGDEKKLRRTYRQTLHSYRSGVYFDNEKNRYIRYSGPTNTKRFAKKQASRATRRCQHRLNHAQYKKVYDLWWTVY